MDKDMKMILSIINKSHLQKMNKPAVSVNDVLNHEIEKKNIDVLRKERIDKPKEEKKLVPSD
jgi:hypothetical protein